jgi:hypothetical protein
MAAAIGRSGYFRDWVKYFKSGWAGSLFGRITRASARLLQVERSLGRRGKPVFALHRSFV